MAFIQNRVKSGILLFYLYRDLWSIIIMCKKCFAEEGKGNTFQYSCLENSMDRGAWWANIHSVTKSDKTEHICMHKVAGGEGWYGDDWSTLHLLCTLFLLLLYQLLLRSSGIRSWSFGTPALAHSTGDFAHGKFSYVLFLFGRHIPMVLQWGWFGPLWSIWRHF